MYDKGEAVLTVRISSELEARLEKLAQRTGRTKSYYAREAIEHHINELEEMYWAQEAITRWETGDKKTIPAEQLYSELEL